MKKSIIVLLMVIVAVSLFVGCKNEPEAKTYKVGDTIKLGSKGNTPIEWLVLEIDTEDNTALLISKDILESRQFDTNTNSYGSSAIKNYLNQPETVETFFKNYGLKTDYMVKVDVTSNIEKTEKNTGSDYVFLLSKTEAGNTKYFKDDAARIAKYGEDAAIWFLRSPYDSMDTHSISGVGTDGKISTCVVSQQLGIRPAFWCKLSEISN